MSVYIAKKYQVEWATSSLKSDDITKFVEEFPDYYFANEFEDGVKYTFKIESLQELIENETASNEVKETAKLLLELGDKDNDSIYVVVDY